MKLYLVTVKVPRNPSHNPDNKQTGECPANPDAVCTDMTGEHHTLLWQGETVLEAVMHHQAQGLHVTRVEGV